MGEEPTCTTCGNDTAHLPVRYRCTCTDCSCPIIEFETEPNATPYCCGQLMVRIT